MSVPLKSRYWAGVGGRTRSVGSICRVETWRQGLQVWFCSIIEYSQQSPDVVGADIYFRVPAGYY